MSTLIGVRDTKHEEYIDQILGLVETNLRVDPAYFNYHADLPLRLADPHIKKVVVLKIKTH